MAKLVWGQTGDRIYETGVDRGVLYPESGPGVPWNGLISVNEEVSGGEVSEYHLDGVKYLDWVGIEDFKASVEALSAPREFAECDGTKSIAPGLFATNQRRKTFGLVYRTRVGNDIRDDLGYKIHIVYNATAEPAPRASRTLSDSPSPSVLKWTLATVPVRPTGSRPTAHFIVDSTQADPAVVSQIEGILYGTASEAPRLVTITELMNTFTGLQTIKLVSSSAGVYEIYDVDSGSRAFLQPHKPSDPDISEAPILWLDNSSGTYVEPKLVTGG